MKLAKRKVLVTGADGFIGSHLTEHLVTIGCSVKAFVYYNSFNSWGWLDNVPKNILSSIEIIAGDIRDADRVNQAVQGCEVVFHLAALIAIPYSYHSPYSYMDTNVMGTLNILQSSKHTNVERILITSTSEVYGTALYAPIDEKHPLQAQSPYSASKIAADKIGESFYRSFGLPVVTVRPFNTYGPRQSARAVIPTIISQLMLGEDKIQLGDISPTRDFTYVFDTVQGFTALAEADQAVGQTVNIASNLEYSIKQIADILIEKLNKEAKISVEPSRLRPKDSEVYRLIGDNTLIKNLTGWKPKFDIKTGLQATIDWLADEENRRLYKGSIYNI